jgi:hypothetical protein
MQPLRISARRLAVTATLGAILAACGRYTGDSATTTPPPQFSA